MPHFFTKNLRAVAFPAQSENFKFIFEAKSARDKSAIIFAESTHGGQKILLSKQEKDGKFLVKFNKHFASHSKEIIKSALKEYADLVGAEIASHNLNENKIKVGSAYLLGWREICALLGGKFALGRTFRTCENFGEQQTQKSSFIPKISSKYKTSTANTRICEKNADSANQTQNAESMLDSATRTLSKHEANSSIVDEFLGFCKASDEDRTLSPSRKRDEAIPKKSPQDAEFAKDEFAMLEIGFGSGRHILHLAQTHPTARIIGLEIYRPAISQVLRQIELLNLQNLYLASIDARVLFEVLPAQCLDRIFLHFPVPWDKNPQRRVLSKQFLSNAMRALKKGGIFELLTDSAEYFAFAKALARDYKCVAEEGAEGEVVSKYEARWRKQKKVIYRLQIFGNSVLGMQFRTCEKFWESTDLGLVLSQNFSQIQKPHRNHFDCDSQSESTTNQMQNAESTLDSANSQNLGEKISSLRADSQNLRGKPPIKKTQDSQSGLPREQSSLAMTDFDGLPRRFCESARNDEFLDSSLRKCSARNDNISADSATRAKTAEFSLDSAPFAPKKICKKEYFLHIKNKYIFEGGVVVFASFGAYYAPSSAYFVICGDEVSTISEIIPTRANIDAVGLFMELCFDN